MSKTSWRRHEKCYTVPMQKKLIIANWKMNPAKGAEARKLWKAVSSVGATLKNVETVICPPLVYLESIGESVKSRSCVLGAQDAFWEHDGPFTGQVSPDMIFNARARYVIVGHSERRELGETDDMINKKLKSILQFPLIPILCVGEKKRDEGLEYVKIVKSQLKLALSGIDAHDVERVVIAYEPVWAIGAKAKRACTAVECREMAHVIRQVLADLLGDTEKAKNAQIVYGGSVNDENLQGFLTDGGVSGALVGHASLDAKTFIKMLKIAEKV